MYLNVMKNRGTPVAIVKYLRFTDLKAAGIINNRVTLARMIKSGFPPGKLLGPNTRAWPETEIEAWLASRPVVRAPDMAPREERFAVRAAAAAKATAGPAKRQRPGRTTPKRQRRGR
jgi:hypothetical protein